MIKSNSKQGESDLVLKSVSASSLAAFRIAFGLVMIWSLSRFMVEGWVDELLIKPTFFFKYEWAKWMPVWEPWGLFLHFGVTLLCAIGVTLGLFYRWSILGFGIGFTLIQCMDATNYLNHYYLVVCLSILAYFLPLHADFSLDRWRFLNRVKESNVSNEDVSIRKNYGQTFFGKYTVLDRQKRAWVPFWMILLLRFQVGLVYGFAAIAKMGEDWIFSAQPLSIWLRARTDLFGLDLGLDAPWFAYAMSWSGLLYDTSIVFFLCWRRTRIWAYLAVLFFHIFTALLFDIGIFPWLMIAITPIYFRPSWLRDLISYFQTFGIKEKFRKKPELHHYKKVHPCLKPKDQSRVSLSPVLESSEIPSFPSLSFASKGILILWCGFHLLFPLRSFWLSERVLWDEIGMRYSWRVMVREKMGSITYRVRRFQDGREWEFNPLSILQPRQYSEMSGQPDLIVQFAYTVHRIFLKRFRSHTQKKEISIQGRNSLLIKDEDFGVFVDAWVSLNGRPPQRLIDPEVNLLQISSSSWILPLEPIPALSPFKNQ